MQLILSCVLIFWSFTAIFLICEFGENVTSRFNGLNNAIWQCNWYSFSIDIQRMLPLIIQAMQQPIFLQGSRYILCIRETFKKVNSVHRKVEIEFNSSNVIWCNFVSDRHQRLYIFGFCLYNATWINFR